MSWPLACFDSHHGTRDLLRRLAGSPLVRQSLPNTAAICAQYFAFRRLPQEHEFVPHPRDLGVCRVFRDTPQAEDQVDPDEPDAQPDETAADTSGDQGTGDSRDAGPGASPTRTATASRENRPFTPAPTPIEPAEPFLDPALDEMGLADSFIMGVLRGWRLLQAASLNNDEKRDHTQSHGL